MRPDSLTPRRLASVIIAISPSPTSTRWSARPRKLGIETMAATPAEIDTATVNV